MQRRHFARIASASLLGGASLLSLATPASAQQVLFSTARDVPVGTIAAGREVALAGATVQVRLVGGGVASFVGNAQFSIRADGSVDLRSGSVTIVASGGAATVHLPDGVRGDVAAGATGSFTANAGGSRGAAAAGQVSVTAAGTTKIFGPGQFWTAPTGQAPDRVIAGEAAAVPVAERGDTGPVVPLREGGVVAAAENGIPVALGEALAAVGARGDIVAAARRIEAFDANPVVTRLPGGDYALLVAYAAQASTIGGAPAFNGAGADIVRTYFEYLATGRSGPAFRTAYAQILLNYLDLLRSGVLPSTFTGATQAQLNAYLAFIGRTDGFGSLSAANRQLLDAYLAFLQTGGQPNAFGTSLTSLTTAFLTYVRGGGDPAAFTQASASVVGQYLAIVNSGGLRTNLTAQNQALLAAYLANNGIGFTAGYASGLAAFVAYLNTGGLPSAYTALPPATIRQYLEVLETTGLFDRVLANQAAFLRDYLAFLRTGGTPDQFNALPINIARVNASALSAFVDYLLAGGLPSTYSVLTAAQVRAALDQLTATGQFTALLGANAAFLNEYYAYLRTGADPDTFAGLPSVDVNAYASALSAFAAYLRTGGLPSGYGTLTAQQVRNYLTALSVGGKLSLLGTDQALLADYLAYLRTGGAPDQFAGLPIVTYQGYATALSAYFAYLNTGGLPTAYTTLTQAQIRQYLDVLRANGQLTLLGTNAQFYTDYLAYLAAGGAPDQFTRLPIVTFQGYATALTAYFAYLNAGGTPSAYTALTQAQVRAYLDQLKAANQLTALLGANAQFYTDYLAYLAGGGAPDQFTGLPIVTYRGYATALAAYYAFLVGGGTPGAYTALTQAQIRSYLDALKAAGQSTALLGANAAFFDAYLTYLAGGGDANAYPGLPSSTYGQYASALIAYFAFLNAGGLPSGYTALTQAQIRQYLDVLRANNQLTALLGANAAFFESYLAFLASGGSPDAFAGLPIVTYRGYASALTAYYAYLAGGGLPGGYTALTQAQVRAYLDALKAAGQSTALLGANAAFFDAYLTYLAGGGAPDQFAGLPAVTFANYGSAIQAFVAFLRGGGLPSAYTALTPAQLREYLAVLQSNGQLTRIGAQADIDLINGYAAFLASGGVPNQFAGLPAFVTYEAALRTYYAYLQGGGRPSAYTALTQAQIVAYIQALDAAGLVAARLTATEAAFLRDYAAFVAGGGTADQFAGLPGNQGPTLPTVTQGLANAPRASAGNLGLATAGKGLNTAVTTSGNVMLSGNAVSAFSGAGSGSGAGATTQSAQTVEARTVNQTIAIARLSNGTYNTNSTVTTSANEGAHLVWGTPATQLPSAAVVTYGLVTATQPTVEGGAFAPGTFTGNLAVHLGTRRVGWDSVIAIGGTSYRFATAGGIAAPSMDLATNNSWSAASSTQNNGLAGTGTGFLSGVGAPFAGFSYQATLPEQRGTVTGAAIFGKDQAAVTLPAVTYVPSTGGGGLTQTPFAYVAGLPTTGVSVRAIYPSTTAGLASVTTLSNPGVSLTSTGGLENTGAGASNQFARRNAVQRDAAGDARVLVGRWAGPATYNRLGIETELGAQQSVHYFIGVRPTFTVPYLGQVNYTLLAATQPTYAGGNTGAGLFDARMAILFASDPRIAMEGTIRMPETNGTATYSFTTTGGVTNPAQAAAIPIGNGEFQLPVALSGGGFACQSTQCRIVFNASFAGTDPLRIGTTYYTTDGSRASAPTITGAAAFAGTWVGAAQSVTTVTDRSFVAIAPLAQSPLNLSAGTYDIDGTGRVIGMTNGLGLYDRIGTAQVAESGQTTGGAIGWTRWSNGTLDLRRNGTGSVVLNANQGYQILHGAPVTNLPTSGTVNYTLAGGTAPTDHAGTRSPGQLVSGSAAVTFGTTRKVAFDMVTSIGGVSYNLFTTGKIAGIATSEITYDSTGRFSNVIGPGGNVTSTDCTGTQCRPIWNGFLAGDGATALGLNYQVQNTTTQARFGGIAAFQAAATTPTPPPTGGSGFTGTLNQQVTYAYNSSTLIDQGVTTTTYENGAIKSYRSFLTNTDKVAGVAQESGRLADVIGWARWTGDTAGPLGNQGPNAGVHILTGSPTAVATLPTSGTVQYTLAGGTKPTLTSSPTGPAIAAPGTITGSLGVAFGAQARVGIDITATVGDYGWRVQTTGGAANPSQSQMTVGSTGTFSSAFTKQIGVTPTTATSCITACSGTIGGQFYGPGGSHVGLAFNMLDASPGAAVQSSGIAIFTKP